MRRSLAVAVIGCCAWHPHSADADTNTWRASADIELDDDAILQDKTRHVKGGRTRAVLVGEHTMGNFFVRGRAEALLKRSGETTRDDLFIQFGASSWDLQLGRFEAWDLGPKGKDTVVNDVLGTHYLGNMARGRANNGQIALHMKATDRIALELAAKHGSTHRVSAVRSAVRLQSDKVTATAGIEQDWAARKNGAAVNLNLKHGPTTLNLSLARVLGDGDAATTTVGANAVRGPFGIGLLHSRSKTTETTLYAGYTRDLPGVKNTSVTLGASHSMAGGGVQGAAKDKTSLRIRIVILFE